MTDGSTGPENGAPTSARAVTLWFIDSADPAAQLRAGVTNDVDDAQALAQGVYGDHVLTPFIDTDLATAASAADSHVYAGSYGGLSVVSCSLFATDRPSTLTRTVTMLRTSRLISLLHTDPQQSVGAFARWDAGELRRSFSANPVDMYEDSGLPFVFERPFWAGEHPLRYAPGVAPEPFALPFHPQELAEAANRQWLGFRFTRPLADTDVDPSRIPVTGFSIHPAGYEPSEEDVAAYRRGLVRAPHASAPASAERSPGPADAESVPDDEITQATGPKRRGRLARYFGF